MHHLAYFLLLVDTAAHKGLDRIALMAFLLFYSGTDECLDHTTALLCYFCSTKLDDILLSLVEQK
jgi:hypothetical protein